MQFLKVFFINKGVTSLEKKAAHFLRYSVKSFHWLKMPEEWLLKEFKILNYTGSHTDYGMRIKL